MNEINTTDEKFNEPSSNSILDWDKNHQLHPWAAIHDWRGSNNMLMENSKGIYLWDNTGEKFIDALGGMWFVQIVYGRKAC
tara:strand:- start:393 stop:635 length:243 start_codon:yes stop_codon:yes gene_type:complete